MGRRDETSKEGISGLKGTWVRIIQRWDHKMGWTHLSIHLTHIFGGLD